MFVDILITGGCYVCGHFDNRIVRYWLTFRFVVLMIFINTFSGIIDLRGLMRNMKPQKTDIQQTYN